MVHYWWNIFNWLATDGTSAICSLRVEHQQITCYAWNISKWLVTGGTSALVEIQPKCSIYNLQFRIDICEKGYCLSASIELDLLFERNFCQILNYKYLWDNGQIWTNRQINVLTRYYTDWQFNARTE